MKFQPNSYDKMVFQLLYKLHIYIFYVYMTFRGSRLNIFFLIFKYQGLKLIFVIQIVLKLKFYFHICDKLDSYNPLRDPIP